MKEIKLNHWKNNSPILFCMVDDSDYEWLNRWRWSYSKRGSTCYVVRAGENKKMIYMHRLILGITNSKVHVDHRDFNGLNNQRINLRAITQAQNNQNVRSRKNSSSKYVGVFWSKAYKKWYSQIQKSGTKKHIGCFINETDAALAYNKKAVELFGEFANLNIIP